MWCIDSPPKVNLYLRIVRRREDGYHELETVFQTVDGGDRLCAREAEGLSLACDTPGIPVDEHNLVLRAALLLRDRRPEVAARGAALELSKRTPVGAGMGGGSADAAAALRLLEALWNAPLGPEEATEMAAALGSDVPFFLMGGTALARGRGETLGPLPTPRLWLVLCKPETGVGTPWAYRQWNPGSGGGASVEEFTQALAGGDPGCVAALLRNDLEPGVEAGVPQIRAAREWLLRAGALGARMTGSGSAVFGIARDEEHARRIAAQPDPPGVTWVARCLTAAEARLSPYRSGSREAPRAGEEPA